MILKLLGAFVFGGCIFIGIYQYHAGDIFRSCAAFGYAGVLLFYELGN